VKALVFLLVLVNVLFYAFSAGYFGRPPNPDGHRIEQQLMPERLRIVSRGEAPKAPAAPPVPAESPVQEGMASETPAEASDKPDKQEKAAATETAAPAHAPAQAPVQAQAPEASACLLWSHLSATDADRVTTLLAGKFADYKVKRQVEPGEGNGWWVYIPPLPGKAEADKKAGELRALEITDYFILQDGASRHAISLGVFSSEKGAQDRLAELKAKGVRSAKLMPRPGKDATVTVQATGPASAKAAVRGAVTGIVPKVAVQACP
jgi:hypothetical protein